MRVATTARQTEQSIARLLQSRTIVRFDRDRGAFVHRDILATLKERALAAVDAFHGAQPLKPGMPREAVRGHLPDIVPAKLFHAIVEALVEDGAFSPDRELARRPGHRVQDTQRGKGLAASVERVATLYREARLTPPRPAEVSAQLKLGDKEVKEAIDLLSRGGTLVKVADLHFDRDALADLRGRLIAYLREKKQITAQEWKELVGATRKYAIPLAEYFDAEKVTLRVGEIRRLRGG